MTDTQCAVCGRPVADQAYLCDRETRMLAVDLAEVPGLEPELEVTLSRQDRVGEAGGGGVTKRSEEPLPYSTVASEAGYVLTNTLTTWARHVAEERGVPGPQGGPVATVAARWLLGHVQWLRHRPEAAEAYDEITSAVGMVRLVIDRHGSRLYAGPCTTPGDNGVPCAADLETRPGARLIRCRTCGAEHDAQHRRDWLLASAEQQLLTATELSRALPDLLGRELKVNTIRTWAGAGRLVPHGTTPEGWPLYRVGEVITLAFATPPRNRARSGPRGQGWIYFMLAGDRVKIGYTRDVKRRSQELKVDEILAWYEGDHEDERTALRRFEHLHLAGEWFVASVELLDYARGLGEAAC